MSKKIIIPLLILVASGLAFAALVASKPSHPPAVAQARVWVVDVARIQPGEHVPEVTLFGSVESPHTARIKSAVTADVTGLRVQEGDLVEQGQVLLTLDTSDYQLALDQRNAELAEVEAQISNEHQRHATNQSSLEDDLALLALYRKGVEREVDLLSKQLGSDARADDTRKLLRQQALQVKQRRLAIREHEARLAQLNAQAARVRSLRDRAALDLQRTMIRAPFQGRVTENLVSPGDRVRPGDPLVDLYDRATMEVRGQLPSRYLAEVRNAIDKGMQLHAEPISAGQVGRLRVSRLAGMIRRGSGGLDILFELPAEGHGLTLGQTIQLRLNLPTLTGIVALPAGALYGDQRVYAVDDDKLHGIPVQVLGSRKGDDGASRVLVSSPELQAGMPIITTQLPTAVDGLLVRINE